MLQILNKKIKKRAYFLGNDDAHSNNQSSALQKHDPATQVATSIQDKSNPQSLINLLPERSKLRAALETVEEGLLGMEESELRLIVKPGRQLNMVRLAFWAEYDHSLRVGNKMEIKRIYAGICTKEALPKMLTSRKMAWILTPPTRYKSALNEALDLGLCQLRVILAAPVVDSKGELKTASANVVLRAFQMIDERVNGGVVQKIEQKTLSVNKTLAPEVAQPTPEQIADLDKKILEMQRKVALGEANKTPKIIDAIVVEKTSTLDVKSAEKTCDIPVINEQKTTINTKTVSTTTVPNSNPFIGE